MDLKPYFEWYVQWANWGTYTVEQIKDGIFGDPFCMLSEWLDRVSLIPAECVGKKVFYSVNSVQRNELTYDTWFEGCTICEGIVQKVDANTITIDDKTYWLQSDQQGILFDRPEYCLVSMTFDGADICNIDVNGEITIGKGYSDDLISFDISVKNGGKEDDKSIHFDCWERK